MQTQAEKMKEPRLAQNGAALIAAVRPEQLVAAVG